MAIERDIELHTKNLQSCDLQQTHIRSQIQNLSEQGTELSKKHDDISLQIYSTKKGGAERKRLEERVDEINEFVEANQNTRMTLLDQRAETDKEKQRLTHTLNAKKRDRDRLNKQLKTVKELSRANAGTSGTSDALISYLKEQSQHMRDYFSEHTPENDFITAMQEHENDSKYLSRIEDGMREMVASSYEPARAERAQHVGAMLKDLVDLRRSWSDLLEDAWLREDLNFSCFFERTKPLALPGSSGPVGSAGTGALALPGLEGAGFPQLMDTAWLGGGAGPAGAPPPGAPPALADRR